MYGPYCDLSTHIILFILENICKLIRLSIAWKQYIGETRENMYGSHFKIIRKYSAEFLNIFEFVILTTIAQSKNFRQLIIKKNKNK